MVSAFIHRQARGAPSAADKTVSIETTAVISRSSVCCIEVDLHHQTNY